MTDKSEREQALEHLELGNQSQSEGHSIQAMDEWKQAIRLDPDLVEAHFNLGLSYADQGDLDRAVAELEIAYGLEPSDEEIRGEYIQALNEHGVRAGAAGNAAPATADWERALEVDPENPDAHYNLGMACAEAGQLGAAEDHLRAAAHANPDDVNIREGLAHVLIARGDTSGAKSELIEALGVGSRFNQAMATSAQSSLAGLHGLDVEKYQDTAHLVKEMNSRLAGIALTLVQIQLEEGDFDGASGALEQAPFTPAQAPLWLQIGRAYIDQGRLEEAVLPLRRAYQADNTLTEARDLMDQLGVPYEEPPAEEELEENEEGLDREGAGEPEEEDEDDEEGEEQEPGK